MKPISTAGVGVAAVLIVAIIALTTARSAEAVRHRSSIGSGVDSIIPAPTALPTGDAVQTAMDAQSHLIEQLAEHEESIAARPQPASAPAPAHAEAASDSDSDEFEDDAEGEDEAGADDEFEAEAFIDANGNEPLTNAAPIPDSMLQVEAAAEAEARAAHRPRGIGTIALPRRDGTMTRVDLARKAFRERIRRRLKGGGMMRRYAPELFGQDIYGTDENDNVKLGSRESIFNAMNGPFAPLPKPSKMRTPIQPDAIRRAMYNDALRHKKLDKNARIRHSEYYLKNDPTANAYTYLPRNHRNPFGFGRVKAIARRDQSLDVGPFEGPRFRHSTGHPDLAFSKGAQKNGRLPLPSNPRLPFAESDAMIQGMRPSKLQQFPEFKPPPKIPKIAPPPPEDKKDAPTNGDTPE